MFGSIHIKIKSYQLFIYPDSFNQLLKFDFLSNSTDEIK
jgi:hypothetical protein